MGAEDEFPVPVGNPAAIRQAGGALLKVADDVSWSAAGIGAERGGLATAWGGPAGTAAANEVTAASTVGRDFEKHARSGAAAVNAYGTALGSAIDAVNAIRRQAHDAAPPDLVPLRTRYSQVIEDLRKAATRSAGELTAAVPGYKTGMRPADATAASLAAVDAKLPSIAAQHAGADLAAQVKPLLDKGKQIPDDVLAKIEAHQGNQWFAKSFLEGLGPQAPEWSIRVMAGNGTDPKYNQRLITDFGTLLAVGTSAGPAKLSDSYVDEFLKPLDQHNGVGVEYARALGHLLHFGGTFGQDFLRKAGDKLDSLEHDGEKNGYSLARGYTPRSITLDRVPNDPMESYFTALSHTPAAAQDFFEHSDRLKYYLVDREMDTYLGDRGKALGDALAAATTTFRDGTPAGLRSARIGADLLHQLGQQGHEWMDEAHREALRPAVVKVLQSFKEDVYFSLSRQGEPLTRVADPALGANVHLGDELLGDDRYGITVGSGDLIQVLAQVDHDTEQYAKVIESQLQAANRYLDADMRYVAEHPAERDAVLTRYGSEYGRMLNTLFDTHLQVQHDLGVEKDDQRGKKWLTTVSVANVLWTVLPFVIPGVGPLSLVGRFGINIGIGVTLPWLIHGASEPQYTDAADSAAVKQANTWYALNQYALVDRIQNGGGLAGTPGDAATWQDAHDVPAAERFTGADGRVLPLEKMTQAQANQYLRWHVDEGSHGVRQETSQFRDAMESQVNIPPTAIK